MTSFVLDGMTVLEEALTAEGWQVRLRVERASRLFEGHFEGEPILPGVTHLVLVRDALRMLGGCDVTLAGLSAVRFRQPIRPGDVMEMVVATPDARGRARFVVHAEGQLAVTGVVESRRG
jgi:3-hydroxymyristoyl/3-hydroxydecanoyl-(acyl carrier protein) dehydratase